MEQGKRENSLRGGFSSFGVTERVCRDGKRDNGQRDDWKSQGCWREGL